MIKKEFKPNPKQQECIDNIEGKFLVLAGPGTGKTFTVIQRIKTMLNKGIEPNKILCLTFSDTAASEIRERILKELNQDIKATQVNIFTYHSFCNKILSENSEEFELGENFKLIPESISRKFFKECIEELDVVAYKSTKANPYVYLKTIMDGVSEIKRNRITKHEYFNNIEENPAWKPALKALYEEKEDIIKNNKKMTKKVLGGIETLENKILKAQELWQYFELYKKKMEMENYIDYNDMINLVLDKFESTPTFLEKIANNFEYILVDEYQDTNKSQNDIVFNLASAIKSQNVFVVGDDDQIIFSFQGARLDTIENFLENFPDTKVICLNENMRSTQAILDIARLVAKEDKRSLENNPKFEKYNIDKNLIAKNEEITKKDKKVKLTQYQDTMQEYLDIVENVENIIKNGQKDLSQIAILMKSHDEISEIAKLFKNRNIPFELKDGKNIFEIRAVIVLYYYLQLLVNPAKYAPNFFKLLLMEPFKINSNDYLKLQEKRGFNKLFDELIKEEKEFCDEEKIKNFLLTYNYLKDYKNKENLRNVIIETASKTGILAYFINSEINKQENILGLKKFIDEAISFNKNNKQNTLEEFIENLEIDIAENIIITTDKPPVETNAIQISTYHSSKGREYEYVFMPTLQASGWESSSMSLKPKIPTSLSEYKDDDTWKSLKISDRIKTMYVGITRAKHALYLSYTANSPLSSMIEKSKENMEITLKEPYSLENYFEEAKKSLIKKDYDYKRDFNALIDAKLSTLNFSPSSIGLYLSCPMKYLFEYILDLAPIAGNMDAAHYGTAVHNACEFMIKEAKEKEVYPSKEIFIQEFLKELSKLPISGQLERKTLEDNGKRELEQYYTQLSSTPIKQLHLVEHTLLDTFEGVNFKGRIDRIDKLNENEFIIYDYKTGKPKNEKTINLEGEYANYYMQMGLYKYFFEKLTGKKVKETTFIFPQDHTKNYTVNFTQEEMNEIIEKFRDIIKNIQNHNFEKTNCENSCQYCSYKDFCKLNIL